MDWRDVARSQAGTISRSQLIECRLSEDTIRGSVGRGDLVRLLPGVYTPRPVPGSFRQRAWSAVLWSEGVLSHRTAAELWDLPGPRSAAIHVTSDRALHPPAVAQVGVVLHRLPIAARTTTTIDGLKVTNRAATVLDLLRTESFLAARDIFDRSMQHGLVDTDGLLSAIEAGRGRAGNIQLRRLLDQAEPGADAESERLLHRLLRRARITGWVPQYRVRLASGYAYVDVAFPQEQIAVEVDGRRYHDAASGRFESDRARQNELQAQGWRVLRFTWRMINDDPAGVIAQILEIVRDSAA